MKIIIDNKIPFIKGALEKVSDVVYLPGSKISAQDVRDADGLIIRTRTKCNKDLLEGSSVKFIATATIGYDHIDTSYCEKAGIKWSNAPGCNSSSVEQYVVSALLYLSTIEGLDLRSSTLGVIGAGNVGTKVAKVAAALGCKVLLNDPPRAESEGGNGFCELEELLNKADLVSMHVPLTRSGEYKTFSMANEDFFRKMKSGTVFINTSRGEVVDDKALIEAIDTERLSHVVMDVFNNEPRVRMDLLERLTLATPHIAGYSTDGKANGTMMSVQALSRFFGLGIDNWVAQNVPRPANPEILIDSAEGEMSELLMEAYARTYSIQEDHDRFIDNVSSFESLRGNYRIRREPSAYKLRLFNDDGTYRKIFEALGFSVIGDSCF